MSPKQPPQTLTYTFPLLESEPEFTLGRPTPNTPKGEVADLAVESQFVSRKHVQLKAQVEAGVLALRDCASRSGTAIITDPDTLLGLASMDDLRGCLQVIPLTNEYLMVHTPTFVLCLARARKGDGATVVPYRLYYRVELSASGLSLRRLSASYFARKTNSSPDSTVVIQLSDSEAENGFTELTFVGTPPRETGPRKWELEAATLEPLTDTSKGLTSLAPKEAKLSPWKPGPAKSDVSLGASAFEGSNPSVTTARGREGAPTDSALHGINLPEVETTGCIQEMRLSPEPSDRGGVLASAETSLSEPDVPLEGLKLEKEWLVESATTEWMAVSRDTSMVSESSVKLEENARPKKRLTPAQPGTPTSYETFPKNGKEATPLSQAKVAASETHNSPESSYLKGTQKHTPNQNEKHAQPLDAQNLVGLEEASLSDVEERLGEGFLSRVSSESEESTTRIIIAFKPFPAPLPAVSLGPSVDNVRNKRKHDEDSVKETKRHKVHTSRLTLFPLTTRDLGFALAGSVAMFTALCVLPDPTL